MKRGKRRGKRAIGHPIHQHAPVTDRRIVPVDDGPLRKRASGDCKRAMARLENARAELRRFEQEDRPSFGRWMAATFGALLTELRENARVIYEQQSLIEEVEMEMIISGHNNPRKAYAAVMRDRENPRGHGDFEDAEASHGADGDQNGDAEEEEADDAFEEIGADIPEADRRALFDDFARSVLGMNPKRMGKAQYEDLYAEFEAEMFGGPSQSSPIQPRKPAAPSVRQEDTRIREIYRLLVRRLHPDVRADGDATVSAIWHEVQEAYEARNLDRLETLLALTEMEGGTNGAHATLSQMARALADFNRAFRAIQRSLAQAKSDPAWGFSRNPYHGQIEKRIRRELEETLADQRWALSDLKRIVDDFSRPWHPPTKRPRRQSQPSKRPEAGHRGDHTDGPRPVQAELFQL
jgi:hypothetical protein